MGEFRNPISTNCRPADYVEFPGSRYQTDPSVHALAASKARTSADPTWPVPPTTKKAKAHGCLSAVTNTGLV
jgi:hypothetical protein